MGSECSDGQSGNDGLACFPHLEPHCAVGTVLDEGRKGNRRCASEQPLQRNASGKVIHMLCQRPEEEISGVFFSMP